MRNYDFCDQKQEIILFIFLQFYINTGILLQRQTSSRAICSEIRPHSPQPSPANLRLTVNQIREEARFDVATAACCAPLTRQLPRDRLCGIHSRCLFHWTFADKLAFSRENTYPKPVSELKLARFSSNRCETNTKLTVNIFFLGGPTLSGQ